jgi:hypothetical protein
VCSEIISGRTGIIPVCPETVPVTQKIVFVFKNVFGRSFFRRLIRSRIVETPKLSREVADAKPENFLFDSYFYVFTDDFYCSKA